MPYLVWKGTEIATEVELKRGKRWRCFCGCRTISEYAMRVHLDSAHEMTVVDLRQDNENYDGKVI